MCGRNLDFFNAHSCSRQTSLPHTHLPASKLTGALFLRAIMTKVNLSRQSRNNVVIATVAHVGACFLVLLTSLFSTAHASPSSDLEKQFSDIFVKRSFTLRNFYRGGRLRYDTTGLLLSEAEPGYW